MRFHVSALMLALCLSGSSAHAEDLWQYPVIHGYGGVHPYPNLGEHLDPSRLYKVVFELDQAAKVTGKAVPGLEHAARFYNLAAIDRLPSDKLQIAIVIYGEATNAVLKAEHWPTTGTNPNLDAIAQLRKAGAKIYVCAQALLEHGLQQSWVTEDVEIVQAGNTALANYMSKGFMPFRN